MRKRRYTPINCSRCGRFVGADGNPDVGYNVDEGVYDIGYPECGHCIRKRAEKRLTAEVTERHK